MEDLTAAEIKSVTTVRKANYIDPRFQENVIPLGRQQFERHF
jgi:hypothetical protein